MQLSLFNEAKEFFLKAIEATKISGDRVDIEGSVVGKTSDRAKLCLIRICLAHNDIQSAEKLLEVLKTPYEEKKDFEELAQDPPDWGRKLEISCSS